MAKTEMPITTRGHREIESELERLIRVEREAIKKAIAEARELGDLSENAEYQYAKERQSHIEGRIAQLQGILANSRIVEVGKIKSDKITFGATVNLLDLEKESNIIYQIVGNDEADISKSRISYLSPLGKALIGKQAGDTVIVRAPKGNIEYEIESFDYVE